MQYLTAPPAAHAAYLLQSIGLRSTPLEADILIVVGVVVLVVAAIKAMARAGR